MIIDAMVSPGDGVSAMAEATTPPSIIISRSSASSSSISRAWMAAADAALTEAGAEAGAGRGRL